MREDLWRAAQLQQGLAGGDTLRTNAIGNLAILFKDQTQIRVGRNSTLTLNDVAEGGNGNTQLSLQAGNIWAASRPWRIRASASRPPRRPRRSGAPIGPCRSMVRARLR